MLPSTSTIHSTFQQSLNNTTTTQQVIVSFLLLPTLVILVILLPILTQTHTHTHARTQTHTFDSLVPVNQRHYTQYTLTTRISSELAAGVGKLDDLNSNGSLAHEKKHIFLSLLPCSPDKPLVLLALYVCNNPLIYINSSTNVIPFLVRRS